MAQYSTTIDAKLTLRLKTRERALSESFSETVPKMTRNGDYQIVLDVSTPTDTFLFSLVGTRADSRKRTLTPPVGKNSYLIVRASPEFCEMALVWLRGATRVKA